MSSEQWVSRSCRQCGGDFGTTAHRVAQGRGIFCSRTCVNESMRISLGERLQSRIDRSAGPDACWPWTGKTRSEDGYGRVWRNGQPVNAHRLVWETANGRTVQVDQVVRHLCPGGGNPWCCNPSHLMVGSHQDNKDDAVQNKRHAHGARTNTAKLTDALVMEIRWRHRAGESNSALGRIFGLSNQAISALVRGLTWKHVPMPPLHLEEAP